jgi:hypothetical protein
MLNKQKVKSFRGDFEKAVAQLGKDYGVAISLGTISFNDNELRAKMTAKVGDAPVKASKDEFNVGDIVGINHKTVDKNDEFKIVKINNKNIKVQKISTSGAFDVGVGRVGALMNVSPGLLILK